MLTVDTTPKNYLFGLGVFIILFGLLSSTTHLWQLDGIVLSPSGSTTVLVGVGIAALGFLWTKSISLTPYSFSLGLCAVFVSDWLCRHYSFFQGPAIRGEVLLGALLSFLLFVKFSVRWLKLWLGMAVCLLFYCFISQSEGRLLFSDDHATFFYRMELLKQNFPYIPFYNPLWNAGLDARDFFATGSLNFFLLFSPIIYLFDLEVSYNYLVISLLFVLLPGSLFISARLFGLDKVACTLSALIGLSMSLNWHKWSLKYGTLGFITACVLMPLVLSISLKILVQPKKVGLSRSILFAVISSLMLCWSASAIALLPILLAAIIFIKRLLHHKPILLSAVLLICLNLPWMLIFWSASNVGNFLEKEKPRITQSATVDGATSNSFNFTRTAFKHKAGGVDFEDALRTLRAAAHATNPLILVFTLPGLLLLKGAVRTYCLVLFGWLLFLGSVAVPLKPQLELDRMLLVATLLGCIPSGAAIARCFQVALKERTVLTMAPACLIAGFVITGPLVSGSFLKNRTLEQYHFRDDSVIELIDFIGTQEENGRILFAGCVVHELSHGHLAPLTLYHSTPLVASSHVHNLWRYKDVFPSSVLESGDAGKQEYMNALNITGIFAHDAEQRAYFRKKNQLFEEAWRSDTFVYYKRKNYTSNYFLAGQGKILKQTNNSVELKLNGENAIIKFRYFPFLKSNQCTLLEHVVSPELSLIELKNCKPDSLIKIESANPFTRIGM